MSYVRSVLQPNEKILVIGRLHWIVYMQAILLLVIGILLVALGYNFTNESTRSVAGNMPLGSGYQFLSSYGESCHCWAAGDRIGVLRGLGNAPPIE